MSTQPAQAPALPDPPPPARPAYRLTVDGRDITPVINARLVELTLTENRGFEADQLDITLDDSDGALDLPPRGAEIRLALGWAGAKLENKGSYTVDEVEHTGAPDRLIIRARSADLRAGLTTKREQSWHDTTLGTIVRSIASRNAIAAVIAERFADQVIEHLDQTDESDANLLTRLAQEFDAIATVKAERLLFAQAGKATTASGQPLEPITITRQSGDTHRFAVADRKAYTGVRAWWHDLRTGEKKEVIAGDDATPEDPEATEPSAGNIKTLRHIHPTRRDAENAARAEWQRLQRGVAEFSITLAKGRPEIIPELPVQMRGFKPQIDEAEWLLARVTHRLTDGGLTTGLELEVLIRDLAG